MGDGKACYQCGETGHLSANCPNKSRPGFKEMCGDFRRGECSRGDRCRYSHEGPGGVSTRADGREMCGDFKRGMCSRGDTCRYSHDIGGGLGGRARSRSPNRGLGLGAMPRQSLVGIPLTAAAGMPLYGQLLAMGAGAPATGLPPGWEAALDPNSGRYYYANRTTGQTQWTPPEGTMDPAAAGSMPCAAATMGGTQPEIGMAGALPEMGMAGALPEMGMVGALPVGWETGTDPASGRQFYFNRGTGQTSWTPPAA